MNTSRIWIGFLGAGFILCAAPAYAQAGFTGAKPVTGIAPEKGKQEPPPAVPGSRAEPTAAAPASRPALDMPPTEALFDAVNRGDLAATKDALGRGADLNGRNVLGLSPLDLAIDLGRNEITFVLLSLRGTEAPASASPPVTTAAAKPETARQGAARLPSRREMAKQRTEQRVMVRSAGYSSPARRAPTAPQAPRLFAGDGGAPNPRAGFLGFDSTR
jgi:hypothetical protein